MGFDVLVFIAALLAGAIASIAGFGIGSLLTPVLAISVGTKLAIAAVSIPHLAGTAIRFWKLRRDLDLRVLWSFGITSAAGGLAGALLNAGTSSPKLTIALGALLVITGTNGLIGLTRRLKFHGPLAWIAGAASGFFGGLVGNQGGLRSAAMLGFELSRDSFVATATAIGLFVDGARMPVYLIVQGRSLLTIAPIIAVTTLGVVTGTIAGTQLLRRVPQSIFLRLVSALIVILGVYMLGKGAGWWS